MQMYNDEYDHYNKVPEPKHRDGDIYLKAALQEHDKASGLKQPVTNVNGEAKTNGDAPKFGSEDSGANGDLPAVYHNRGFQLQATEI